MINKNPEKIKNLFDNIFDCYDFMNNIISLGLHLFIKECCIKDLNIKQNSKILDICCGTGDITKVTNKLYPTASVVGVDFSENMLNLARIKNPNNRFINASATNLPFNDNEFDFVTISFGLRNIENRDKVICEIYRVLKDGGVFLHLDFGNKNFLSNIFNFYVLFISLFMKKNREHYKYLVNSKKEFPLPDNLTGLFENYNFKLKKKKNFILNTISMQILEKINVQTC